MSNFTNFRKKSKNFFKKLLTIIFLYARLINVRGGYEMKKKRRYVLKPFWTVVLFYTEIVIATLLLIYVR